MDLLIQRFKEMREMHGSSSRDDRQKRELLRQEKEMAKFAQMYAFLTHYILLSSLFLLVPSLITYLQLYVLI